MSDDLGVVLTGGGARASYQVGALRALYEIMHAGKKENISYLTGTSAGAINTTFLAAKAEDFDVATRDLLKLWQSLQPEDVYRTDVLSLTRIGSRWMSGSILGGLKVKGAKINYLLDNSPLKRLLHKAVSMEKIEENCLNGKIKGIALTATNYFSGSSVVFYNGAESIKSWNRTDRFGLRTKLGIEHILGSCSIPFFFPPTRIGESYYGDGCIRQTTPLSPCIHLGAKKIIAIGIRHLRTQEKAVELSLKPQFDSPGIAQIAGMTLNSVFLDSLEADVERMERINQTIKRAGGHPELRPIPVLMLRPSRDLGVIAGQVIRELPRTIRYLLRSIGAGEKDGSDLISYLAFDNSFTTPLIDLGYHDTLKRKAEIEDFLS